MTREDLMRIAKPVRAPLWALFVMAYAAPTWAGTALTQVEDAEKSVLPASAPALRVRWADEDPEKYIREHYSKREYRVPMRDGVHLHTAVYAPTDTSQRYPVLMLRTPYSSWPYGEDHYPSDLGPSDLFPPEGYIFVCQDVRGCFMSEGEFVNMTPHVPNKSKPAQIDESTDTYDTIEWLLAKVENHNRRVGQWGISYPGFYSAAGMIDAHPALKAVSPQASVADWFFDDFHHHGAFFLPHAFNFFAGFGKPRPELTKEWPADFDHGTPDGYQFFLNLGSLKNANERYLKGEIPFWNDIAAHPNYDEFWQKRNILPHLRNVAPAVMTVGGWFDAEDLYGTVQTYQTLEKNNPGIFNVFVMGPWLHGGWGRTDGDALGNITFGAQTALYYREKLELPFFNYFLKDKGTLDLPEASVFETGTNIWRAFDHWPPEDSYERTLYLHGAARLTFEPPSDPGPVYDEYISDPAKPVPFTEEITVNMTAEYMTDDQRFAARRPDVLAYQTDVLDHAITLAGPIVAELWVSTSGTDADWVVKLIDVFPPDTPDHDGVRPGQHLGGYQMMVRSEVLRGRFRNSYEKPEPFVPRQPTRLRVPLQDVLHTFKPGHRIMVQIQSTWFPLVDRNPQKYVDNIYLAKEDDFIRATQRVYRSQEYPSRLVVGVLPADDGVTSR